MEQMLIMDKINQLQVNCQQPTQLLIALSNKTANTQKNELQELCKRLKNMSFSIINNPHEVNHFSPQSMWLTDQPELIERLQQHHIALVGYETDEETRLSCSYILQSLEGLEELDFIRMYQRQKGIPWEIAKTKRCRIREITMEDMPELFALYQPLEITKYMDPLFPWEEELEYQRNYISQVYGFFEYGMWVVEDRQTGKLIGRVGLEPKPDLGMDIAELGYVIALEYQGKGYGKEVVEATINYAKEYLGLRNLIARVDKNHKVSIHILESFGFVFEEEKQEYHLCFQ